MKKSIFFFLSVLTAAAFLLAGCGDANYGLSAENPESIVLWHCFDGSAADEFDALVEEFNDTAGREYGVYVTAVYMGSQQSLESTLFDCINQKTGAPQMPDVFCCWQDLAAALEDEIGLVDLDDYVTEDEKLNYVRRFLDVGCVGSDEKWKLFTVAAATDVLMLNKTDWDKFARDTGADTDDLLTWEGIAQTAAEYYEWSGGKAFFGIDSPSNYIIIGSSQLGSELFKTSDSGVRLNFDSDAMRTIWDNFYVPIDSGFYAQTNSYRSDDMRTGEIIAMVCSSTRAAYFPDSVAATDGSSYPIDCMVLPLPNFSGNASYAMLECSAMAVTQSTPAREYACVLFLEWLTQDEQSLSFSAQTGYMPVTLATAKTDAVTSYFAQNTTDSVISDTVLTSLSQNDKYIMYTPAGFADGTKAKTILRQSFFTRVSGDEDADSEDGADDESETKSEEAKTQEDDYDALFEKWYSDTLSSLQEIFR